MISSVVVLTAALVVAWRWKRRTAQRGLSSRRRGALLAVATLVGLQALVGAPALGQSLDCKEAPNPERPGSGMVGAIDPAPMGTGFPGSSYDEFGYSGLVWHTYDLGCGPQGVTNPNAIVDTWVGNELFNVGKTLVAATNGLHYSLLSGGLVKPLDDAVATGTNALYNSVFTPWFGVVASLMAVLLFRYIYQGDLAAIGKRGMWALAGLWLAAASYLMPLVYTHALDGVVITGTSAVQAGFLREINVDERNALPTMLHDQVVYRNWLRGEFGSPDSPQARDLGRQLLAAQSWSKQEVLLGQDGGSPQPKKDQFEDVAGKMGSAYSTFQGIDGTRVGSGMLAMMQGVAYSTFQLMAKAAILLGQVLLRILILSGPLLGLVSMLYPQMLRAVGRMAGAALLNVVMIAAMAGMHTFVLTWIFDPTHGFSMLAQIMLAGLVTLVFLLLGKPLRRMGQMVELSVGGVGGSVPRMPRSVFSRFGGRGTQQQPSTSDEFWDQVRDSDPDEESVTAPRGRRRARPEAEYQPVSATAQRLDRDGSAPVLTAGGSSAGALPPPGSGAPQRPGTRASYALPEGRPSRLIDTAPVADAKWDLHDDDPVLVPSRAYESSIPVDEPQDLSPRRADMEVVQGRPVYVVYRPSRGLEVADGG